MKKVVNSAIFISEDDSFKSFMNQKFVVLARSNGSDVGRGGYIYIFRPSNSNNVYRVFADTNNNHLIFQQIRTVFKVDGKDYYDDPEDYDDIKGSEYVNDWSGFVTDWVNQCEQRFPNYTEYYDEDDNQIDGPVAAKSDQETYTFRIYFKDGNRKLLEGENMYSVLSYLYFDKGYGAHDIYKIEEIDD